MPRQRDCIDTQQLLEFLLGRVEESRAGVMEEHLSTCSQCAKSLTKIRAEDALVDCIRAAAANPTPVEDGVVETLLERICHDPPAHLTQATASLSTVDDLDKLLSPPLQDGDLGRLGPYRILGILGRGGMGVVFRAEDPQLSRDVAIKVLRPELLNKQNMRQRFLREARATAALQHKHIIAIHHVGEEGGVPYFTMPLLEGETLAQKLKRDGQLSPRSVIEIGRQIADGLAAAHEHGLVHRDVNPANVWLKEMDGVDNPQDDGINIAVHATILDFGLARITDETEQLTQTGNVLGTPGYIAPEQANEETLDGRCDQFGLGCTLYEMSTGKAPFRRASVMASLLATANETPTAPNRLCPEISDDLSALILKLLAKDPKRRFDLCREVLVAFDKCTDRRHWLPPLRRWLIAGGILAGLVAIVVLLSSAFSQWPFSFVQKSAKQQKTTKTADIVNDGLLHLKPLQRFAGHTSAVLSVAISPNGKLAASGSADNTIRIWDVKSAETVHVFEGHTGEVRAVDFSPRGDFVISASADRTVRLWDVLEKKPIWRGAKHSDEYHDVAFSRDGAQAIGASRHKDISIWNPNNAEPLTKLRWHQCAVRCVAFAPDGRHAVSADENGNVILWDTKEPRPKFKYKGHTRVVTSVQVSRFGRFAVTSSWDKTVRLWDLREGKQHYCLKGHNGQVFAAALTADNVWILSGGADPKIRLWHATSGKLHGFLEGHTDHVMGIATSRDSRYALSAGADHSVLLWRLPKGKTDLTDP